MDKEGESAELQLLRDQETDAKQALDTLEDARSEHVVAVPRYGASMISRITSLEVYEIIFTPPSVFKHSPS